MAQQQQQEEEEEDALLPQQGEGDEDEEGFEVAAAASRVRGLMQHGCKHYRRRCRMVAPCCGEVFWCRHCHNEVKTANEWVRQVGQKSLSCRRCPRLLF